jgi:hypothetical protein
MNSLRPLVIVLAALVASSAARSAEPNFVSIFNGKDLTGWTPGRGASLWTVQNGVLVGTSDAKREGSTLRTEKAYKNFIFEFDVKYLPPADSGITMRSPSLQMQIGTSHSQRTELTGSFYQGQLGYPDHATAKDNWRFQKPGDWNTMRIEAKGSIFKVFMNGQQIISYSDDGHPEPGTLSVQVHNNEDMKIEFKNMRVAELP